MFTMFTYKICSESFKSSKEDHRCSLGIHGIAPVVDHILYAESKDWKKLYKKFFFVKI